MIIFFNSIVVLLVAGLVSVLDFLLDRVIYYTVYNWIGLNPSSPWWWSFIVYGIVYVAAFEIFLTLSRIEVRLAYLSRHGLYGLLHTVYNYIGSQGQWWGPYLLIPMTLLHAVDVFLVAAGQFAPEIWWAIFVVIVGLWGLYLFGEPMVKPKKAVAAEGEATAAGGEAEKEVTQLKYADFINHLRDAIWYYGQISYEVTPSMPDASPLMPVEVENQYSKIRGLCEAQKSVFAADSDVEKMYEDHLLKIIVQHLLKTKDEHPQLYKHQADTLKLLSPDERFDEKGNPLHVILATPIGSGRKTVALVAALRRVLQEHQSLMIVFPDRYTGMPQAKLLRDALTQDNPWHWAIRIDEFWDKPDDRSTMEWSQERYCPDILFTSVEFLHQYLLPNHARWQYFFQQLGLMIVENLDEITGVFALNSSYVFSRLQRILSHYDSKPQILAIAQANAQVGDKFQRLFRTSAPKEGRIITSDGRETLPKSLLIWNPPLLREKPEDPASQMVGIFRKNFYLEIQTLVTELIRFGYKPAIISRDVPITESDVSQFYNDIAGILSTVDTFDGVDIPIGQSFRHMLTRTGKVTRDNPANYTACIIIGNVNSWAAIQHEIAHLGEERRQEVDQPVIIYVTPDTPYAQFAARNPIQFLNQIKESHPVESRPTTVNAQLAEKHLFYAVSELPLSEKEAERFFGEEGEKALIKLEEDNRIRSKRKSGWDSDKKQPVDELIFTCDKPVDIPKDLQTIESDLWRAVLQDDPGRLLGLIDRYLLPQIAYQGAVICFDGQRYRVENIDPKKKNILLASENRPSHTEVLLTADLKLKAGVNANSHAIAMGIAPRKSASLARGGVEVSIRHAGSRSYEGFGFEAPHFQGPSEDRKSSELEAAEISTYAVTIAFDDLKLKPAVLHSIGHLFKVVLPFFITNAAREVRVVELQSCEWMGGKPAIVVYENIPGGNGIAELIENDLARIFNRAYEILVRCPCTDGCQGCLKIPDCSHVDANDELDKIGTIEFLGDLLSKNSAETVKNRTEAIDSASEAEYYRWEIVDLILPYRLGLRIGEAADFLVENDPAAKGWPEYIAGYYIPAQNRVEVRPQREQDMIACLAHEYGHNWQFQGAPKGMDQKLMGAENVPYFSGRLVIEGFAQWIEFKAADHYGFRQAAKDIVFRHCDEYKEGFELLKWLEENSGGGVNRVIEFMINGEVKLGKKVVKLDDLIFAAKMKQRFLEAEARLKTRPQEDIQTKENAPKPPVPPEPVSPPAAPPPPETGVELPPTQGEKPAGEPPQAEAGANLPPAGETPVSEPPQAEAVAEEPQTPISEPPLPEVAPEEPQAPVSEPPHVEGPAEPSGVAETESAILGEPPTAPAPETPEQPGGTTEEHSAIN